ncbi:hypothetical protein [Lactococcus protaetiae]|uniref:Uncharacterized protein n=1 Tax=Lactococcus protaetiae TaxID=2592653 RepID=A0A514Z6P9_9LACT|nr:hypothetical protein [Lactococcus protaetiae]QDK70157.1 hypothetical protein FLP15_01910 [Lactococcus protaetiae]
MIGVVVVLVLICMVLSSFLFFILSQKEKEKKKLLNQRERWLSDVQWVQKELENNLEKDINVLGTFKLFEEIYPMLFISRDSNWEKFYKRRLESYKKRYRK